MGKESESERKAEGGKEEEKPVPGKRPKEDEQAGKGDRPKDETDRRGDQQPPPRDQATAGGQRETGAERAPRDLPPKGGRAEAVDQFDQLGQQPLSDAEREQGGAPAFGGVPLPGPGMGILEQRLQHVEGDPGFLMRNQFLLEETEFLRSAGGPLGESRPW